MKLFVDPVSLVLDLKNIEMFISDGEPDVFPLDGVRHQNIDNTFFSSFF